MRKLFFGLGLVSLLASCSGNKPDEAAYEVNADSVTVAEPPVSEEVISSVIQQIPSPLEISVLLKESGSSYDRSLLNEADNKSKYNSNYQKAVNLGIYGTDLGYTNIYEQNQDGLDYMDAIKEMADGLSIGQFFDIETIGRLATNSKNLDSLLLITTQNFNEINHYLQEQSRANLSVLLLTGGWLEAMHITTQIAQKNPDNKALSETIGEQKIILDNITILLSFYESTDPRIADLHGQMKDLQSIYEAVEITHTYEESTYEIVDGVMVIKDNSSSEINISPETETAIRNKVEEIRKGVIN
ncbi:hypothetical protein [Fulvivirga sedimenti]|uniref:Uncharacterized protein n=1 Tax=Fulvivirga sedimenti TaxID=2879465 RepID=A0A9X1HUM9_9BACT|nr:hypothetical protein [Fulvivirga sedimenti]MCA6077996.1 hypothetical protein [Fulvivirga sedimenti]